MAIPYRYGIKNRYVPTHLIKKAYGFSGTSSNMADVPTRLMANGTTMSAEEFRQNFAYEWLGSSEVNSGYTNPPFVSGASGRLLPMLQTKEGVPARIQRGYIRRGEVEAGQNISKARLYFMFNPETISRDYVSYLDQTALDPFNTVYQSQNLVAPPSILDFSFTLFFDRAEEAMDEEHPGCFVDYQFFDLVVRNVTPDDPASTGNTLPDNGVMMVNPREITVVFSQQLTVQGRPLNARVSFLKFTHRMVPTRMQIDLTVRATYLGPLRPQTTYVAEEWTTADTVPIGEGLASGYQFNYEGVEAGLDPTTPESSGNVAAGGAGARMSALDYAIAHVIPTSAEDSGKYPPNKTKYGGTTRRNYEMKVVDGKQIFDYVDCSSLVVRSYIGVNAAQGMGWNLGTWTGDMVTQAKNPSSFPGQVRAFNETNLRFWAQKGDLLLRSAGHAGHASGHVSFFGGMDGNGFTNFAAHSNGFTPQVGWGRFGSVSSGAYEYILRPEPSGATSQYGNTNNAYNVTDAWAGNS